VLVEDRCHRSHRIARAPATSERRPSRSPPGGDARPSDVPVGHPSLRRFSSRPSDDSRLKARPPSLPRGV
jgi:hypothetical protein